MTVKDKDNRKVIAVPASTHRRLCVAAAIRGITVGEMVVELSKGLSFDEHEIRQIVDAIE